MVYDEPLSMIADLPKIRERGLYVLLVASFVHNPQAKSRVAMVCGDCVQRRLDSFLRLWRAGITETEERHAQTRERGYCEWHDLQHGQPLTIHGSRSGRWSSRK